jgi:hypothetical protein
MSDDIKQELEIFLPKALANIIVQYGCVFYLDSQLWVEDIITGLFFLTNGKLLHKTRTGWEGRSNSDVLHANPYFLAHRGWYATGRSYTLDLKDDRRIIETCENWILQGTHLAPRTLSKLSRWCDWKGDYFWQSCSEPKKMGFLCYHIPSKTETFYCIPLEMEALQKETSSEWLILDHNEIVVCIQNNLYLLLVKDGQLEIADIFFLKEHAPERSYLISAESTSFVLGQGHWLYTFRRFIKIRTQ